MLATFAGHVAVLLMVFLAFNWIAALAAWLARPGLWEFVLAHLAGAAVVAGAIQYIACPPIGLLGPSSWTFSISCGLALAAAHSGASLSLDRGFPGGLDAATGPIRELGPWPTLAALCILAPLVSVRVAAVDWNFLLQKLVAAALWGLTFGVFFALAPEGRARRPRAAGYLAATLALLGTYRALEAAMLSDPSLGRYAGYDVSYQLVREILAPHTSADPGFYRFLARNTNIGHPVAVQPVEQHLVERLAPAAAGKPDIFIFTFDSLRRDYLSPYNPAVTFTPEIARFAQESAVFQNAFTHYGGTGLSEPSIWAGSLLRAGFRRWCR